MHMQKGRKMTGEIFKKLVIFGFGLVFVFLFFEIENAQAAVSFVGSAENSSVGNTDTTVDLTTITGLAQDDLVIVTGGIGDDDNVNHDVIVNTTGYTEVADLFADDTDDANVAVWYKFMGATPDTSVVVEGSTGGTDSSIAVVVMVFRGVNTTTPMDVTPTTVTGINTMHLTRRPSTTLILQGCGRSSLVAVSISWVGQAHIRFRPAIQRTRLTAGQTTPTT